MVEFEDTVVVIDTGPDFRYQMLREKVHKLDAVVFTHEHKDHTAGLDDIRAFNYKQAHAMDVYASERVQEALKHEFSYIFSEKRYPGIPQINFIEIKNTPFKIQNLVWEPIEVMHYKLPVFGFRIGDFTYITDAKTISEEEKRKVRGSKVLVINALQIDHHISHLNLQEAIDLGLDLQAQTTYFTHISHRLGNHAAIEKILPQTFHLSYDQLTLEL
jgi:phosphoribosyl 1,2-cyclic phosphate phosphodiesterase